MISEKLDPAKPPVMSPEACQKIYDLYIQGWSVRDVCRRFGIIPARAKFVIWSKAQFLHEVLPKSGVKDFVSSHYREKKFAREMTGGYLDYGIDMA